MVLTTFMPSLLRSRLGLILRIVSLLSDFQSLLRSASSMGLLVGINPLPIYRYFWSLTWLPLGADTPIMGLSGSLNSVTVGERRVPLRLLKIASRWWYFGYEPAWGYLTGAGTTRPKRS
jgi:hypothetical protein